MKTKIYLVLLLGLFSMKSNAQEQFLRFDSIQVIQGEQFMTNGDNSFNVFDTVACSSNNLIKVKKIVFEAESTGYSFNSNLYVRNFRCFINGIGISSIHTNYSAGSGTAMSINEVDLFYTSDLVLNWKLEYFRSTSQSIYDMHFRYRIELHHYSYE